MNADWAKLLIDSLVLIAIATGGGIIKRFQTATNSHWDSVEKKLEIISGKLDGNIAQTNRHSSDLAVIKFRLTALDGKAQD